MTADTKNAAGQTATLSEQSSGIGKAILPRLLAFVEDDPTAPYIEIDTGQLHDCPLTGFLEQPSEERLMDHPTAPALWWPCVHVDALGHRRNNPAFDPSQREWHGKAYWGHRQ